VGNIHGSHVFLAGADVTRVFVWGENDHLRAYVFRNGKLVTPPATSLYLITQRHARRHVYRFQRTPTKPVPESCGRWCHSTVDANQQRGVRAQLLAFDAQHIKLDVWRSEPLDASFGPNSVGLFAKFVARPWPTARYSSPVRRFTRSRPGQHDIGNKTCHHRKCSQELLCGRLRPTAVGARQPQRRPEEVARVNNEAGCGSL